MTDLDTLPADLDAERSVLGALMWKRDLHDPVSQIVTGPDFYQPAHELVFNAISHLIETGQPVDPITVANHLRERGELDRAGGPMALADMVGQATPAEESILAHARIIRGHAMRRELLTATARIRQMAEQVADPQEMIFAAQATLDTLAAPAATRPRTAAQVVTDLAASIGTTSYEGLPTPWPDLNRTLGGLQGSRLYVIGARPAVGKSLMGQNLAEHWATRHERAVLYASCEMPAREIGMRMLAHQARINLTQLKSGQLSAAEWGRLGEATDLMAEAYERLHIVDEGNLSVAAIRGHARALAHQHGRVGLIVVDYLQLLTPPATSRRDRNREREVAEITRQFKQLAMELDVPIVLLSQLNRGPEQRADRKPTLADLRESGAIEQDCDVALLMFQPDPDGAPNELEVLVAKNRDGSMGQCDLIRQGWFARLVTETTARQEIPE